MKKVLEFLDGYKSFIVAVTVGILAGLQSYGIVIPEYVYAILGALGLGTIRHAISKLK